MGISSSVYRRDGKLIAENTDVLGFLYLLASAGIEVTGKKAEMLRSKGIDSQEIVLGVRPEHFTLSDKNDSAAISGKIVVNEMMGSETYLYLDYSGEKIVARVDEPVGEEELTVLAVKADKIHHKLLYLPPTVMEDTRIRGCPTLVGTLPLEEPHIP